MMAKRTVASVASNGSEATAAMASHRPSPVQDDGSLATGETVRLSSEETAAPPRRSQLSDDETWSANVTAPPEEEWTFLCPFCCATKLVRPVELHAPVTNATSGRRGEGEPRHCLACQDCAERWCAAMTGLEACTASGADEKRSPLSCPLCDAAVAVAAGPHPFPCLSTASPRDTGSVLLQHPHTIYNSYTGYSPLPSPSALGAGGSGSSVLAAFASHCGVCEAQKATCMCVQCNFGLCKDCHESTHTKGMFRRHEVVGLAEARRRDQQKCGEHAGMPLNLYCNTCASCVCVTCCFGGTHAGHDVLPLDDVAQRTADGLRERAAELAATQTRAVAAGDDLAALWPLYETKVAAATADIQRCFARLRGILQQREDALLTELRGAASEVRRRSTELRTAAAAMATLLGSASSSLASLQNNVSPATLMRLAQQVQDQEQWTLRASTRLVEETAATVDGWRYQLGEEDSRNGCRMVCFDMLNAQTLNETGIVQYEQVLSDLGRLEVSAELQPPTVRSSARDGSSCSRRSDDASAGEDEGEGAQAAVERSVMLPIVEELPESPTPSQKPRKERSASPASFPHGRGADGRAGQRQRTAVAPYAEEDAPQVRHSHVSPPPVSLDGRLAADACAAAVSEHSMELQLTSGSSAISSGGVSHHSGHSFSRVAALRSVTSARASAPRSLAIGGTREESSFAVSVASSRATSSGSQVRAALDALERRDSEALAAPRPFAALLARDTMPFCVSMPQRRVLSVDRANDGQSGDATGSASWRPLKLHRSSTAQDVAFTADGRRHSSAQPPSVPTRLSFFSEFEVSKPHKSNTVSPVKGFGGESVTEEPRGTLRRKTTGLQLEL